MIQSILRKLINQSRIAGIMFVLSLLWESGYSQARADSLTERVRTLENYKENIQQLYQINSEKLNKHIDEKIDEKVKDVNEQKQILNLLLFIGIPGTVISLLGVYIGAFARAKKFIIKRIETIVEQKREELIKLIETQEFDTKLKKNKKLLILSKSEESQEKVKNLFSKFRFQNVKFRIISDYVEITDADLIVFNDYETMFTQELIDQYLSNSSEDEVGFVAFTTQNLRRDQKLNFSNSPFTLYHNILSTLKYNEILKLTDTKS